ncbi:hypothetical protein [Halomarina ordinaria]|nr:hypothetical protein [Halomarina sp. PSRA2]
MVADHCRSRPPSATRATATPEGASSHPVVRDDDRDRDYDHDYDNETQTR